MYVSIQIYKNMTVIEGLSVRDKGEGERVMRKERQC
jgi:hypothetical protein